MTLKIAWVGRPILYWFCLDNPQTGDGSKQVPDAAVVRDEVEIFLQFATLVKYNSRSGSLTVVSVAVVASPVETKPPTAVGEHISKDGRHDLGDVSPFSTRTSSLQGRAGGSAIMPKLVELIFGPGSTRQAEKLSPM